MDNILIKKKFKVINTNNTTALFFKDLAIGDIFEFIYNISNIKKNNSYYNSQYIIPIITLKTNNKEYNMTLNDFFLKSKKIVLEEII